ncbi:MAG: AIPR family protein [Lachnospiraceae bacterium]|nr:AIPR family protein [Lachnospiraceae bacterium]
MAQNIDELVQEFYNQFRGLPNTKSIVRNSQPNDAYTIAILQLLYAQDMNIRIAPDNIDQICQYIVAPKDNGVDLFIERESGDEYYYDVIQAKYSDLDENSIKNCFLEMKDAVKRYLKDPKSVAPNLQNVIGATSFCNSYKKNVTYYVVHKGATKYSRSWDEKDIVVTNSDLEVILYSINHPDVRGKEKVPYEELSSDAYDNFMFYEPHVHSADPMQKGKDRALLCSIRGIDLALLCEKYNSTARGRNILFGENLRESLADKSKTYSDMAATIDKEPERFWHYNNGITIIAEQVDSVRKPDTQTESIQLTNFSIINGAQTTSSLFEYLKDARLSYDQDRMDNLSKVYVLARLMEVTQDDKFGDNIAIYNNSQNAITSRDMVSRNAEQRELQNRYFSGGKPNIFVHIKRGVGKPSNPMIEKHQEVTNEELAQLAFAAFLQEPFSAKNKKSSLFTKDSKTKGVLVNVDYQKIFNYIPASYTPVSTGDPEIDKVANNLGILFSVDKYDVDEVLFVKYLYRAARAKLKNFYEEQMENLQMKIDSATDPSIIKINQEMFSQAQRNKEINNTCFFYCVTLYFAERNLYAETIDGTFDYGKFYGNSMDSYKADIIQYFADNFLTETIDIINKCMGTENNVGNWIRRSGSQNEFLTELRKNIVGTRYSSIFRKFAQNFKTVPKV